MIWYNTDKNITEKLQILDLCYINVEQCVFPRMFDITSLDWERNAFKGVCMYYARKVIITEDKDIT